MTAMKTHEAHGSADMHGSVGSKFACPVTAGDGKTHLVACAQHTRAALGDGRYPTLCQITVIPASPAVAGLPCVACGVVADQVNLSDSFGLNSRRITRWLREALTHCR